MLFTLGAGKSRIGSRAARRRFFVVKVNKITPGNALIAPGLIAQIQSELGQRSLAGLCARSSSPRSSARLKAKRNNSAIEAFRTRLTHQRRLTRRA